MRELIYELYWWISCVKYSIKQRSLSLKFIWFYYDLIRQMFVCHLCYIIIEIWLNLLNIQFKVEVLLSVQLLQAEENCTKPICLNGNTLSCILCFENQSFWLLLQVRDNEVERLFLIFINVIVKFIPSLLFNA